MRLLRLLVLALAWAGVTAAFAAGEPPALETTELGTGPTIVFVSDVGTARSSWMPVARRLVAKHRVVLVDLPGHGGSALPDPFSVEAAAAALDVVLARQPKDSTIVVGRGVGGLLSSVAAGAHPERARALVLIDAPLRTMAQVPDQQRKQFLDWIEGNYDQFIKMTYGMAGRDSAESAEVLAGVMQVPPVTMKAYFRMLLGLDVSTALDNYQRPILYVGSGRQWPDDKSWAAIAKERGFDRIPTPDTLRIGSSWLQVLKDQPDTLATAVAAMVQRGLAAKK
jgi:pimeloyl-ACP methyl ester carboxylesterase